MFLYFRWELIAISGCQRNLLTLGQQQYEKKTKVQIIFEQLTIVEDFINTFQHTAYINLYRTQWKHTALQVDARSIMHVSWLVFVNSPIHRPNDITQDGKCTLDIIITFQWELWQCFCLRARSLGGVSDSRRSSRLLARKFLTQPDQVG